MLTHLEIFRSARISLSLSICVAAIATTPDRCWSQQTTERPAVVANADDAPDTELSKTDSDTLVLISPLSSKFVYLVNANGKVLHEWEFEKGGFNAYLFPDGTLTRGSPEPEIDQFDARGSTGRVQRVDWDGNMLWDYKYASDQELHHHDYEVLPNGNVLMIVWEKISREEALKLGRDPDKLAADDIYSEKIVEIKPDGKTGGQQVWVWRLWDHLVQDFDEALPNYDQPSQLPRRVDLNYVRDPQSDWIHMNAVDYHPGFDQLALSPRWFDEIWIIDHSTTTEEAASSSGGRHGHGGDLLYRFGNPMSYGHGALEDKLLFGQHNCMWIPEGFPGAGDMTIFNNGTSPPRTGFSSVEQFSLPVDSNGVYRMNASGGFEAPSTEWSYSRGNEMFSFRISGVERLASGNTLICSGDQPWILEVTPAKKVVWENRKTYGGGPSDAEDWDDGAMFRAPGYTIDYFTDEIQAKIRAAQ